ncbi:recombinase family protein [Sporosarcina sp. ACRSM]|uniref:recombinase family protein n=1 Tax=Sporosarcina sp. ACRSM TaxID=2918216 RepID=UPI001EF73E34|nr:recombinase family protein [Sporosarcina sp. ACRSM]MCG7337177.1 recombinase family protein [Sporosarcina sp. ACRSM]
MKGEKIGMSYGRYFVHDKQDISTQQGAIDNHAEKHGIRIMKHYQDISYPRNAGSRPHLQMMLQDLQSEDVPVDHLLIYSSCRIIRDTESNVRTILEVLNHVDSVVLVKEQVTYTADDFKWLTTSLIRPSLGAGF